MPTPKQTILLLTTPQSYRTPAFQAAANTLGLHLLTIVDLPDALATEWQLKHALNFSHPDAATHLTTLAQQNNARAIIAVDDSGGQLAATASANLGLPHNNPNAALAARDKHLMRQQLSTGGALCPHFQLAHTGDDFTTLATQIDYPCVVKPTRLSGSRGVIRANSPAEFITAAGRLTRILTDLRGPGSHPFLIEEYIPGVEVALEGLMDNGRCHILALFDKPDPLDGPFFEETIYVTPSRLPPASQAEIATQTALAAQALGLRHGPIHAELRLNNNGAYIVEIAGRSIGGLCSRILNFTLESATQETDDPQNATASLEELILRQLVQASLPLNREPQARGVMMIPIPQAGLLRHVNGLDDARAIPGIDDIEITAKENYPLVPLPEGDSYLGFIFAHGDTPTTVENTLRAAANQLHYTIDPIIPLSLRTLP
ncbi:MAG TPA: ATP-grasp domain-containing protein [Anaerolineae bacterium]|nr:ATP-grasp domain-containing protein [Anaerolineae bacterium]